jgi:hypothetical protein
VGYLEVDRLAECLWIHWYGIADMYAWQEANGLPRDKYLVQSGSVTVEQTPDGLLLYCEVWPLGDDGKVHVEPGTYPATRSVIAPYVEPIPEGIGKLIDWDFQVPQRNLRQNEDAA